MNLAKKALVDDHRLETFSIKTFDTGFSITDIQNHYNKFKNAGFNIFPVKIMLNEYTDITVYNHYHNTAFIHYACETGFVCTSFKDSEKSIVFEIDDILYKIDAEHKKPDGTCGIKLATQQDCDKILQSYPIIDINERSRYATYHCYALFNNTIRLFNKNEGGRNDYGF